MKISDKGLQLLKDWEGCRLSVYRDAAGLPTIGIGHLIKKGESFTTLTIEQALELLAADLAPFERTVNAGVSVPLAQDQFDALVIFAFNVGAAGFAQSTLLKKLNAGNYDAVPEQLMRWTKAGGKQCQGLVNRRQNEIKLWRGEL